MDRNMEDKKTELKQALGVPFVGVADATVGEELILRVLCARELGERAIACGDEVILVGAACGAEIAALRKLGVAEVVVPGNADVMALEGALSPATKAVWVCADATADAVCTVRNLCNAFELWMMASVAVEEARRCTFEGCAYHVGAVSDVAVGRLPEASFACTKDALPYQLMLREGAK